MVVSAKNHKAKPIEVITLGVFHFNFPNLDAQTITKTEEIDVLEEKYQSEIEYLVEMLADFNPTIIAIERQPNKQAHIDSKYKSYLQNNYELSRAEEEQIGFRLAKRLGLKNLHCVDEWGKLYKNVDNVIMGRDSLGSVKLNDYWEMNSDKSKEFKINHVFKSKGIIEELKLLNNQETIERSLGNYLIGLFKYEDQKRDFFGVDFESGRWFNRNMRIFRNIQRIKTTESSRILVIFGSDHMNLLNLFFDASPEYDRLNTLDFLSPVKYKETFAK
jgi:hypothetical protein